MYQRNYIGTEEQTTGWPVLDLTNQQYPTYVEEGQIRSLSPACYRITVKNTITVTGATIVVSNTSTQGGTEPGTCITPGGAIIDPSATGYYNLVATVTASVSQTGVVIEFDYLHNDTPVIAPTNQVTVNLTAGPNTVYLFASNQPLAADDTVSLYGARAVSY